MVAQGNDSVVIYSPVLINTNYLFYLYYFIYNKLLFNVNLSFLIYCSSVQETKFLECIRKKSKYDSPSSWGR